MARCNQNALWEPPEWRIVVDIITVCHGLLLTCFHESHSLCRIIAFTKTVLDIYKKALFSRSRTDLGGFKYCWQRQEEGERWGERGREKGGGGGGGSQCPNPWMKSKLYTELPWLALWNQSPPALLLLWDPANLNGVFSTAGCLPATCKGCVYVCRY